MILKYKTLKLTDVNNVACLNISVFRTTVNHCLSQVSFIVISTMYRLDCTKQPDQMLHITLRQ